MQVGRLPVPKSLQTFGQLIKRKLTLIFEKNLTHLIRSRLLASIGIESLGPPPRRIPAGTSGVELPHDLGHELTGDIPHDLLDAPEDLDVGSLKSVTAKLVYQLGKQGSAVSGRAADPLLSLLLLEQRSFRYERKRNEEEAESRNPAPRSTGRSRCHHSGFLSIASCCSPEPPGSNSSRWARIHSASAVLRRS